MAGPRVYEILGQVENVVRGEMEQIAITSGLRFIVNVVLNRKNEVVAVVAGDVVAAHRAGVEVARQIYTVELEEQLDIIIASAYPADRNLWQGAKPICNTGMMVKDGGTLILLISAPEGIAPEHPQLIQFGQTPGEAVLRMVGREKLSDRVDGTGGLDGVAASVYLSLDQTRKRVNIILVTVGMNGDEAARMGFSATTDFDAALAVALARHGDKAQIGVVTHGADIMGSLRA
jgi:nickel-dependent lactate racemase